MEGPGRSTAARGHCWMWHRAEGQREGVVPRAKEFESEFLFPDPG